MNKTRSNSTSAEIDALVEETASAQLYKSCIQSLTNTLLDMPVRRTVHRHIALDCLNTLLVAIKGTRAYETMVKKPFRNVFAILQKDSGRVSSVSDNIITTPS